jgi:Flp pilus assembly protein TadG
MTSRSRNSERGAVLIFVAIALFGLVALSTFVVDYGVLWAARGGAQNAADAGALAGALSLAHGQGNTHAYDAAMAMTKQNGIFNEAATTPNITVTVPLSCPTPFNTPPSTACIKVDVQRQNVPTFFGKMVGIQAQGVKATATAIAGAGNSTECIKPWVVADKWIDNSGTGLNPSGWDQMDEFNPGVDQYVNPGFKATGTGNDFGTQLVLKAGTVGTWSAGWTMEIEFGQSGSSAYKDTITGCPDYVPTIGLYDGVVPCSTKTDAPNPEKGCLDVKPGMSAGPTAQGVSKDSDSLVKRDPYATFDTTTNKIVGGCMAAGTCELSPRVVPIAIFNTAAYVAMDAANGCNGGNCRAQVVNIIGFFVEGMCDEVYPDDATRAALAPYCGTKAEAAKMVVGRLINYPAQYVGSAGAPGPSSFITVTFLIR